MTHMRLLQINKRIILTATTSCSVKWKNSAWVIKNKGFKFHGHQCIKNLPSQKKIEKSHAALNPLINKREQNEVL